MTGTLENMCVGWIGVGAMGLPMCANLARAGFRVKAFDQRPERLALAAERGVEPCGSIQDMVIGARIVFSMVYDDAAFERVVGAQDGVAPAFPAGGLFVDMSTVSPAASARMATTLAQRGIRYLRAPVSGSVPLAENATLTVLASGAHTDFKEALPLLQRISATQRHVGEGEAARVVKLCINLMVIASTALIGEALAFGARQGVPRDTLVDALNASIVGSRHYQSRAESLKLREYNANGSVDLVVKDLELALGIARECGLDLPFCEQMTGPLSQLQRAGHGGTEITILAEHVERLASTPLFQ